MELWIRSQDKTTLKKTNVLDLYTPAEANAENYCILSEGWELGQYKTKERALEVLDEIQTSLLFSETELLDMTGKVENNIRTNNIVYTMPRE